MIVSFAGNSLLDPSIRLFGSVVLNGTNVADVAQLAQGAAPAIFDRGNRTNTIKVTSLYNAYSTYESAEFDALMLSSTVGGQGALVFTTGEAGESNRTVSTTGTLTNVDIVQKGASVQVTLTFVCGLLTASTLPSILNLSPLVACKFNQAITSGSSTVTVVFSTPFPTGHIPEVAATVQEPTTGGIKIYGDVIKDTVTETGFTFALGGPAPTTGYVLSGLAVY